MSKIILRIAAAIILISPLPATASPLEDNFLQSFFSYLAKNRSMNLLSNSGDNAGDIGRFYYLEKPDTEKEFNDWAIKGKEITPIAYEKVFDLNQEIRIQRQQSYVVANVYSSFLAAELELNLRKANVDAQAFASLLREANIRFTVYKKIVDFKPLFDQLGENKDKIISGFKKTGAGEGLILPFQQLVITDFSYNEAAALKLSALVGVDLLGRLGSEAKASSLKTQDVSVSMPASTVIAVKAIPVYFKKTDFWSEWTNN